MLDRDLCRERIRRFRAELPGGADAAVICRREHVLWLGNFFPLPNSLNLHGAGWLVIERDGDVTLFTDNWLGGDMADDPEGTTSADRIVRETWYDGSGPSTPRVALVADSVRRFLETRKIRRIAAETAYLPQRVAAAVESVVDCEPRILSLREVKDADELRAIRRGVAVAEAVHRASRELLAPGQSEIEYYGQLVARATEEAGAPFVMMCDLASGERAARGGGPPTSRRLEAGDLVIHDFFPYVDGYRGDITNTLVVGGEPTREQEELFALVRRGLELGESLLGPGRPVSEVAAAVEDLFAAAGERLIHHTGHAIGLGHPEAPEIVRASERTLEEGMVVTLEPGIYGKPGAPWRGGIRLEHDYLITARGCERLSHNALGLA